MKEKFPIVLLVVYLVLFVFLAISPYDRAVWWAENIPIILIVCCVVVVSMVMRLSNLSYLFMFCLIVLHTIGGHFTFERVPFDWITQMFGFERNHYDRIAHFSVGFYAYPIAEILMRKKMVRSRTVLFLFPIFTIFAVASGYEIIEWLYAISADPSAGAAVLGSQGDVWDAQKDMLADALGAVFATIVFAVLNRKQIQALVRQWN